MKKGFIVLAALGLMLPVGNPAFANATSAFPAPVPSISPFERSKALENYQRRPQSELSKLIYLGDLLRKSQYKIIYNGKTYNPQAISAIVTAYIRLNYKQEDAKNWIRKHAYRSCKGHIIYLQETTGEQLVLRDFLLGEIQTLA